MNEISRLEPCGCVPVNFVQKQIRQNWSEQNYLSEVIFSMDSYLSGWHPFLLTVAYLQFAVAIGRSLCLGCSRQKVMTTICSLSLSLLITLIP